MSRSMRLVLVTVLVFAAIATAYFLVNRGGNSEIHTVAISAAQRSGPIHGALRDRPKVQREMD